MSTNEFVKATGRDKLWEIVAEELKELQGPDGMLKKELERPVKCTLCGIDDTNPVFVKEGFTFVMCKSCGLVYVNPQADSEKLRSWYEHCKSADMWVDMVLQSNQQLEFDRKKFVDCCDVLERVNNGPGNVIDVGCSLGNFLEVARDRGWETLGLELNQKAVKHATETLGLDVRPQLLHEADLKENSFDVLSLWEVLEHVPDPDGLLKDCYKYIRKGGTISILVPNRNALSAMIMQEHCSCFGGRNHLWYFSEDVLTALLEKNGFTVYKEETKTILSQMNEITGYLSYRNPYLSAPGNFDFKIPDDLKAKIEKFIFDNKLGYKLLMYARKD